ncbi:response regulator transcription factor [Streptomyces capparidis]
MTVRVLVVDDPSLFSAGVHHLLARTPGFHLVGEASSAEEALRILRGRRAGPHVVLVDPCMREGLAVTRAVVAGGRRAPRVLAVSLCEGDDTVVAALRAGAGGYVTKEASQDELLRAISTVAAGGAVFGPTIASRLSRYFAEMREAPERLAFPDLTRRELQVLHLIALGWDNRQIARDLVLAEKTVRNYVSQVLGKLGVHHRTGAAVRAREAGLGG